MSILSERIKEYNQNEFQNKKSHYESLASSQKPHTLLITCSDSRLSPQEFGMAEAGELFVIRNAGNLVPESTPSVPSNEGLTVEYAVQALNVQEIVVCGHRSCGAMGAVSSIEKLEGLPQVKTALTKYKEANKDEIESCKDIDALIEWNVRRQMKSLMTYDFVKERVQKGEVKLVGMVYDFVEGQTTYETELNESGDFV